MWQSLPPPQLSPGRDCEGRILLINRWPELIVFKELYTCRNWYRLAALVFGQQEAGLDSFYSSLFIPTHNFAVYRAEMKERPGLPFLAPYLREDYPTRDADFLEVFSPNRTEAVLVPSTTKPSLFGRFKARMRNLN